MSNYLLAPLLLFLATAAFAATPVAPGEAPVKAGKAVPAATASDNEATTAHPLPVPVHGAVTRAPRWHSLLPGMFR